MQPTSASTTIKIVIADDHAIFRNGLVTVLKQYRFCQVIGQASNGTELLALAEQLQPDVVITDIQMPLINGIEATAIISERFPQISVLVLSMCSDEQSVLKVMKAGARGYIFKNADTEELIRALRAVQKSQDIYFDAQKQALLKHVQKKSAELTKVELNVLSLTCKDFSNKEIASFLGTSVRSVESAKERIRKKTGARGVIGIAFYAIKHALFIMNDM